MEPLGSQSKVPKQHCPVVCSEHALAPQDSQLGLQPHPRWKGWRCKPKEPGGICSIREAQRGICTSELPLRARRGGPPPQDTARACRSLGARAAEAVTGGSVHRRVDVHSLALLGTGRAVRLRAGQLAHAGWLPQSHPGEPEASTWNVVLVIKLLSTVRYLEEPTEITS